MKLIDFIKLIDTSVHITLFFDDFSVEDYDSKLQIPVIYYDCVVEWVLPWGLMDLQITVRSVKNGKNLYFN